jgi:hypothetical protein
VSDPADWDEDLKIGGTLETGPEIVFAPRVKLRPPRVSFLLECGPIERGLDNSGLRKQYTLCFSTGSEFIAAGGQLLGPAPCKKYPR